MQIYIGILEEVLKEFINSEYADLISSLIHDTRYIQISNRGKIQGLRSYSEVLFRKLLNIGNDIQITVGQIRDDSTNKAVSRAIKDLDKGIQEALFVTAKRISRLGNIATHTQYTEDFTETDVKEMEEAVLDLYALMFVRYFNNIGVSIFTSPQILRTFSLLPPIIRYKTWKYLFEQNHNNIQVANRLMLSIVKTFNWIEAYNWLERNKVLIKSISYPSYNDMMQYYSMYRFEGESENDIVIIASFNFIDYDNAYDLLKDKLKACQYLINESGKMYKNFEEAVYYYRNEIEKYDELDVEYYDLLNFVFIGVDNFPDRKT